MSKKTVISTSKDTIFKLKILAKKKEGDIFLMGLAIYKPTTFEMLV